jgi:hypothetical protein
MTVTMRLFHKLRRSCFTAEADEVVEIKLIVLGGFSV